MAPAHAAALSTAQASRSSGVGTVPAVQTVSGKNVLSSLQPERLLKTSLVEHDFSRMRKQMLVLRSSPSRVGSSARTFFSYLSHSSSQVMPVTLLRRGIEGAARRRKVEAFTSKKKGHATIHESFNVLPPCACQEVRGRPRP